MLGTEFPRHFPAVNRARWLTSASAIALLAAGLAVTLPPTTAFASSCLLDSNGNGVVDLTDNVQGANSSGSGSNTACGSSAIATSALPDSSNTALGGAATASGNAAFNTATGAFTNALGDNSSNVAVGARADASGTNTLNTAVGANSDATGANSAAFGAGAQASGASSTAVGVGSISSGTDSTAVGTFAEATHDNATAIGDGAQTTRANQQMFGNATNTYTMAGVNSGTSRATQAGALSLVTTDATGNLAGRTAAELGLASSTDLTAVQAGLAAAQAGLADAQGDIAALQNDINRLDRRDDELAEGIAISMALAQPFFHDGQTFAMNVGWGGYDDSNAVGVTAAGIINKGAFGAGSTVTLYGGVGAGTEHNQVAGRAGLSFGW